MRIGGLQKLSLIDFPGHLAAVIFTQGCPWRCRYCHNSSLVRPECFGEPMKESEVWAFLEMRRGQLDGVVVSGGEPTLHADLSEFLKRLQALGFDVKLDTNGVFPERLAPILKAKLVDYVAMDLKADWDKYAEVVGAAVDTDAVKQSMELIRASGIPYEFRTTVSPELPIDVVAIAQHLHKGERYFLQAFQPGGEVYDREMKATVPLSDKERMLKSVADMGLEAAWR